MARIVRNIPKADHLMGSMRSMGYTFEAAIADIIDNSISANSHNVHLFSHLTQSIALLVFWTMEMV